MRLAPRPSRSLPVFLGACLLPSLLYGAMLWRDVPGTLFAPTGSLVVRDYIYIWAGGTLAREGRLDLLFAPQPFAAWLRSIFGARLDLHSWAYPPHALFLALPFSMLPVLPGFLAWTAFGLGLLVAVLRGAGLPAGVALAAILSPAAAENARAGQNGALTAAALAGGLLLADRHLLRAGALIALLTIKPQLGLLVPACLLGGRHWATILSVVLFASLCLLASVAAFGVEAWIGFATGTAPFMSAVMQAPFRGAIYQHMMVSPFMSARAAGLSLGVAYAVQASVPLASLAAVAIAWSPRRRDARREASALTLLLAPLATPYAYTYDMVAAAVGVAMLARRALEDGSIGPGEWVALALAWLWPGSGFLASLIVVPGLAPAAMLPAILVALRRVRQATRRQG